MTRKIPYDPFSPEVMADPLEIYRELRQSYRAFPMPQYDSWALPRFDDVWEVSRDRERFSIVEGPVSHRDRLLVRNDGPPDRRLGDPFPSFSTVDPPVHTTLRNAIVDPFRPGPINAQAETVRAQVRALLDELVPRRRFDVARDFVAPVAMTATLRLLGLPTADGERYVDLVNTFVRRDPGRPGISERGAVAMAELAAAVRADVVAAPDADPSTIIGRLRCLDIDGRRLTDTDVTAQLTTMIIGGAETLPKVIGGGVWSLAHALEQRAALVADPDRIPAAFEEILRYHIPLQWGARTLLEDAVVAGTAMRADERVFMLYVSANRDEREFTEPDRFDVSRPMPRHLGFGHGVHFCIGAHAARLEGIVLLEELLARVPEYVVDEAGVERAESEFQIGFTRMPISF